MISKNIQPDLTIIPLTHRSFNIILPALLQQKYKQKTFFKGK